MITAPLSFIATARAATISMNVPGGSTNATTSPGAFIGNFYQFALMIGGILAFGIIVYGGVRYMISSGNPSGQSDAKEWIEAALLGLLLLVGAYFILNVINPQLTNLTLPKLTPPSITAPATTAGNSCGATACPSGYSPTAITSGNATDCVCENSSGAQGCGGGVAGTTNSCPANTTCTETQNDPVTYSCVSNSTLCGGSTYGTCPAGEGCIISAGGTINNHICSR